jgi:hypothetical protein
MGQMQKAWPLFCKEEMRLERLDPAGTRSLSLAVSWALEEKRGDEKREETVVLYDVANNLFPNWVSFLLLVFRLGLLLEIILYQEGKKKRAQSPWSSILE